MLINVNMPTIIDISRISFLLSGVEHDQSFITSMPAKRTRHGLSLHGLNSKQYCNVVWLFLAVPRGCLQFVIVVFPDHTHLLFL